MRLLAVGAFEASDPLGGEKGFHEIKLRIRPLTMLTLEKDLMPCPEKKKEGYFW